MRSPKSGQGPLLVGTFDCFQFCVGGAADKSTGRGRKAPEEEVEGFTLSWTKGSVVVVRERRTGRRHLRKPQMLSERAGVFAPLRVGVYCSPNFCAKQGAPGGRVAESPSVWTGRMPAPRMRGRCMLLGSTPPANGCHPQESFRRMCGTSVHCRARRPLCGLVTGAGQPSQV